MLRARIPREAVKRRGNAREGDSRKHQAFLRQLPCPIYAEARNIEVHHLLKVDGWPKGLGRKNEDRWAIPLSAQAHRELHAYGNEEEWLSAQGVDGRALAAALWRVSGDLEAGLRAVFKAQQDARLHRMKLAGIAQ